MSVPDDVYTHGHADPVLRSHRWRTVENSAAYLTPRIRNSSRILDVGCGPGTVTVDFARTVGAGSVVGVDRSQTVIDEARLVAEQAGVSNVDFRVGDVYSLGSSFDHVGPAFDIVHAHQVLQHLSDPVRALREMSRMCTPEGVVAVRDSDYSGFTWYPALPQLDQWLRLYQQTARANGAEPDAGRRLKAWARMAGLKVVASSASVWCFSSPRDVAWWGELWAERVVASDIAEQAVAQGLASAADLQDLADGWRQWAASEDAWFALLHGEVLCS
ncbi:MAG: methyltransferase domain-containing protein [Ornithinimicrobium sp.]